MLLQIDPEEVLFMVFYVLDVVLPTVLDKLTSFGVRLRGSPLVG